MGMYKKLANGDLQKLAGYTVIADGSCAEVRHGTATFLPITGTQYYDAAVTFETAMSDTDYQVIFDGFTFNGMSQNMGSYNILQKTITGFSVRYYCDGSPDSRGGSANYTAIKLVTMEGYTELKNKVDNPDSTPTEDSLNLCTSGGIYDAIKNAKNIFTGTLAEWEALTAEQKAEFDVAQIDDGIQVGSLIPTHYTTTEQFTGKYWIDGKKIYTKNIITRLSTYHDTGDKRTFLYSENIPLGDVVSVKGNFSPESSIAWINGIKLSVNACALPNSNVAWFMFTVDNFDSDVTQLPSANCMRIVVSHFENDVTPITAVNLNVCIEYTKSN